MSRKKKLTAERVRNLGSRLSRQRCARPGCGERITLLSKKFGDLYCSRVCSRMVFGLPEPKETFVGRGRLIRIGGGK